MAEANYVDASGNTINTHIIDDHIVFSRDKVYDVISVFPLVKRKSSTEYEYTELFTRALIHSKPKYFSNGYQDVRPLPDCHIPYAVCEEHSSDPADYFTVSKIVFHPSGLYAICGMKEGVVFIIEVESGNILLSRRIRCGKCGDSACAANVRYSIEFTYSDSNCLSYADWSKEEACLAPFVRRALSKRYDLNDGFCDVPSNLVKYTHRICLLAVFGLYQIECHVEFQCQSIEIMLEYEPSRAVPLNLFLGTSAQHPMNFFLVYSDILRCVIRERFEVTIDGLNKCIKKVFDKIKPSADALAEVFETSIKLISLCGCCIRPVADSCEKACIAANTMQMENGFGDAQNLMIVVGSLYKIHSTLDNFEQSLASLGRFSMCMRDAKSPQVNETDDRSPPERYTQHGMNSDVLRKVMLYGSLMSIQVKQFVERDIPEFLRSLNQAYSLAVYYEIE